MGGLNNLAKFVKKMRFSDNSILAIKKGSELANEQAINELMKVLEQTGLKNIVIVVVDDLANVRIFPQEDMEKVGWYRADGLFTKIPILKPSLTEEQLVVTLPKSED